MDSLFIFYKRNFATEKICMLFCFISVYVIAEAQIQEDDIYKGIINSKIKLEFSPFELENTDQYKHSGDSLKVVELDVNKSPIIVPTFHYGLNILRLKELEMMLPEDTTLKVSPLFFEKYSNQAPESVSDRPVQMESMHGVSRMVPRPDYSGGGIRENRKSRKEQRKEKMLKYITTEVYPTDTVTVKQKDPK